MCKLCDGIQLTGHINSKWREAHINDRKRMVGRWQFIYNKNSDCDRWNRKVRYDPSSAKRNNELW